MTDSKRTFLATTGAVIDALGGTAVCGRAVGSSLASVSNWRTKGRFPPRKFLIFSQALAAIGAEAPASLWSIDEPAQAGELVEG
jgi:hypothetical protein